MSAKWIIADDATAPPINITPRSAAPSSPSINDIYLDDGTNTTSGNADFRHYNGTSWVDLGALTGASINLSSLTTDQLFLDDGSELTIVSGAITVTTARHTVDTESDAASDDLDTISGTTVGEVCLLTANNAGRTVVIKDGTGNIATTTGADITLDETYKIVLCVSDGTTVTAAPLFSSGGGGSTTPNFGSAATKTISSGVVTTGSDRNLVVAAESGTADDLIEVTGLSVGDKVLLRADTGDTINVKHNAAGATVKILIQDDSDFTLDEQHPLELVLVATNALAQVYDEASTGGGGSAGLVRLSRSKLSGSDGTFSFTSISGSYDHLELRMMLRSDRVGGATDSILIEFNADTTQTNYNSIGDGYRGDTDGYLASDSAQNELGFVATENNGSNIYSAVFIRIPYYTDTDFDTVIEFRAGIASTGTDSFIRRGQMRWNNTAAITRIDIAPVTGTNWVDGSVAELWGVRA